MTLLPVSLHHAWNLIPCSAACANPREELPLKRWHQSLYSILPTIIRNMSCNSDHNFICKWWALEIKQNNSSKCPFAGRHWGLQQVLHGYQFLRSLKATARRKIAWKCANSFLRTAFQPVLSCQGPADNVLNVPIHIHFGAKGNVRTFTLYVLSIGFISLVFHKCFPSIIKTLAILWGNTKRDDMPFIAALLIEIKEKHNEVMTSKLQQPWAWIRTEVTINTEEFRQKPVLRSKMDTQVGRQADRHVLPPWPTYQMSGQATSVYFGLSLTYPPLLLYISL